MKRSDKVYRTWKKYIIASFVILILFIPISTMAADKKKGSYSTKDEVIYGNLDHRGAVQNMYVVNSFSFQNMAK